MKKRLATVGCVLVMLLALAGCGGGVNKLTVEKIIMDIGDFPIVNFVDESGDPVPMSNNPDEWFTNAQMISWVMSEGSAMTGDETGRLVLTDDSQLMCTFRVDEESLTLILQNGTVLEVEKDGDGWRLVPDGNWQAG
ncbi:hypothetical protein LJC49_06965 [Ruminococcaceae bacterium OttesenSCG-928-I18]|nr:hypothetical protein [Ruminococcaceae bacterium OttesenSCG-928-I18]